MREILPFGRLALLALLLLLFPISAAAQLYVIPYSRNDSAQMRLNDSIAAAREKTGNFKEAARHLDANAMICWNHNDLRPAVDYFNRSVVLNERIGNQNGVAGINSNLAFIYADLEEYEKAFEYLEKTLVVRRAEGKSVGIISALVNESVVLNNLKRYKLSVERLEEALTLAREANDEVQMRSVYGMLSETYQKAGDVNKAMYYYEYYKTFNDHVTRREVAEVHDKLAKQRLEEENLRLQNENNQLAIEKQRFKLELQSKDILSLTAEQRRLVDSLTDQEILNAVLNSENERQRLQNEVLVESRKKGRYVAFTFGLAASILALLVVAILLLLRSRNRHNHELKNKNEMIQEQAQALARSNAMLTNANESLEFHNNEMLASIRSSRSVQDAVFAHSEKLLKLFPESFHFVRPFAIVSGDFHYFRRMPDRRVIVIAGDCTGHGVPGAFLTIMAIATLDRAVFDLRLTDPKDIIDELDASFSLLNIDQDIASHSMDLSMVILSSDGRSMEFAGVKNGLLLVEEDGKTRFLKGNRFFVGMRYSRFPARRAEVETVHVDINGPTWCYLFSDGIVDQFNEESKKFSTKRLLAELPKFSSLPAQKQLVEVEKMVDDWQGNAPQIDDMILVGFRVGTNL